MLVRALLSIPYISMLLEFCPEKAEYLFDLSIKGSAFSGQIDDQNKGKINN
jgi:hypothetical protein